MAKIHGVLDVGRRGMLLSQTAMQTTSHNITNRTTEGYSVQRVEQTTNPTIGEGNFRMGTGAKLSAITRMNNPWIEKQLEKENSTFSQIEQKVAGLSRLEAAVNEQSVKGLSDNIGNFFNAFREIANNPESAVSRTQVREAAVNLVAGFQNARKQISDVTADMNKSIEYNIGEVNAIAKELSTINQKIQDIEVGGHNIANDERDHRDLLLKKLSEKIDIHYAEDKSTGMINVTAGSNAILVAGTTFNQLKTAETSDGKVNVYNELSKGGTLVDISDQVKSGKVGAAFEVRDGTTAQLLSHLEDLAYNIASEVNKAHVEGFDQYGSTGFSFFETKDKTQPFSINNFQLSDRIVENVSRIAVASKPNAPGDNTVANVINNLQSRPFMEDGKYTFDDFYNSKVSEIGILTQRANSSFDSQRNTVDQLKNIRESLSGVNMDEEAAKMIEYQKSFEASARLIKTADEMMDTVLNLKRM